MELPAANAPLSPAEGFAASALPPVRPVRSESRSLAKRYKYPPQKARNDAPVRTARKMLAQAGTRNISATTNAQTRTAVMMIAGRSGVDL
jgi:hypothetical protein